MSNVIRADQLANKILFEFCKVCFVFRMDSVEELCDNCFLWRKSLLRVTFRKSSSLKLIAERLFLGRGVREIHIPDGVEALPWGAGLRHIRIRKP